MRSATAVSPFLFIFQYEAVLSWQLCESRACPSIAGFAVLTLGRIFFRREGACLGVGLAVSSLCKESLVDSRVHVTNLYNKLMNMLNERDDPDQKLQVSSLMSGLITLKIKRCQCRSCFGQVCYILLILNVYKSNKTSRWWRVVTACSQNIYADCR